MYGKCVHQFYSVNLFSKCVNPKYLFWDELLIHLVLLCIVYHKEKGLLDAYNVGYWTQSSFPLQGLYCVVL